MIPNWIGGFTLGDAGVTPGDARDARVLLHA